jgi:hypothetical protein
MLLCGDRSSRRRPRTLSPSLPAYVGHPAYGLDALRCDLDRFAFLLGGNSGEHLLEPERD